MKCGIEIHQQLDTGKLFCRCPSEIRDDVPHRVFRRKLRAVAGETGDIDIAAMQEQARDLTYIYEAYDDTTCLVEADEEPPLPMDEEALDIVLEVSKMLKASFVDQVQVMRKTVVNGSNTSGFQRTALVATDGKLETPSGDVGIPTICIEEDAARDIAREGDEVTYRLDRLGIPLIEIATDPDITTYEQVREVAEKIGMILRSTRKVKRGLGTIRQDVNVSTEGGRRIEIKGAQDLKMISKLAELEVKRQESLIEIKKAFKVLKPKLDSNPEELDLKDCGCSFAAKADCVIGLKLDGFAGLLGKELQPGRRLGTEFSDYAKVKAGVGGIIHSDEDLGKYGFAKEEVVRIRDSLKVGENDAFALVVGTREKCRIAIEAVRLRAKMCSDGVPKEVRKANKDGTTSFLRPMPGAARMYPETDIHPITLSGERLKAITTGELLTEKATRFERVYKVSPDLARMAAKSAWFDLDEMVGRYKNVKPALIAESALVFPKEIKRRHNKELDIKRHIHTVLEKLDAGEINNDAVFELLVDIAHGKKPDFSKFKMVSDEELEKAVKETVSKNKGAPFGALMGMVMGRFRGRADGKKISELVKKHIAKP